MILLISTQSLRAGMDLETFTIPRRDCRLVILSRPWNKMCNLNLSFLVDHNGETYNMSPERPEKETAYQFRVLPACESRSL